MFKFIVVILLLLIYATLTQISIKQDVIKETRSNKKEIFNIEADNELIEKLELIKE